MCDIKAARETINKADKEIAKLFTERMHAVRKVFAYKKEHGLPIFDERRERELLRKNTEYIEDAVLKEYYINFQKNVMEVSKRYQARLQSGIRVAYSGIKGAFAHIAAMKLYPDSEKKSYPNFASAYEAVENGECDIALLPIENSNAGEVGEVTDMIFRRSLYINGMYSLKINQNLLALPSATLSAIKTVISHPQALRQCDEYLKSAGYELREAANTAKAAKEVAESGDNTLAAIASAETAELYGLIILERNINKSRVNTTKFAVLSRVMPQNEDCCSVIMFAVSNNAGSLAKAINVIGKYGFNMTSLRSRPLQGHPWKYYFYVETDKSVNTELGKIMLRELSEHCDMLKAAGCFKEGGVL